MREITENGICMACRETESGIEILRAQTQLQQVEVPAALFDRPVTALGARAFAADSGREAHRRIREVSLPDTLEQVGDYAFYNCTDLRLLRLSDRTERWGGSCLMNCRSLCRLEIRQTAERSATAFYFADELSSELDMSFLRGDEVVMRLIFPEYVESYEANGPARHFDFHLYGAGFPYHHAFRNKELDLALFDGAWTELLKREYDPVCALRLAWYRLCYPQELSERSRQAYENWLGQHCGEALEWLLSEGDCRGIGQFLRRFSPAKEILTETLEAARERRLPEAVAILLEEQHRRFPAGRSKRFDL